MTALLVFVMVVLKCFPETALARSFDQHLALTLTALRRIERRHLIFALALSFFLTVGLDVLMMMGPLDYGAIILVWDISTYLDIVATTVVVATATRGVLGWRALVARVAPRRTARARRQRRTQKAAPPANDDARPALPRAA